MDTNSMSMKKKFMQRGVQDLGRSPLLDVKGDAQNLARFLPLRCVEVKGQALDVETAQTLHSEIFSPLDHFDISTCNAILRNPRQRSN